MRNSAVIRRFSRRDRRRPTRARRTPRRSVGYERPQRLGEDLARLGTHRLQLGRVPVGPISTTGTRIPPVISSTSRRSTTTRRIMSGPSCPPVCPSRSGLTTAYYVRPSEVSPRVGRRHRSGRALRSTASFPKLTRAELEMMARDHACGPYSRPEDRGAVLIWVTSHAQASGIAELARPSVRTMPKLSAKPRNSYGLGEAVSNW